MIENLRIRSLVQLELLFVERTSASTDDLGVQLEQGDRRHTVIDLTGIVKTRVPISVQKTVYS